MPVETSSVLCIVMFVYVYAVCKNKFIHGCSDSCSLTQLAAVVFCRNAPFLLLLRDISLCVNKAR